MTLLQLKKIIDKLSEDKTNHNREIIGDIRPGELLENVELYGKHFITLVAER